MSQHDSPRLAAVGQLLPFVVATESSGKLPLTRRPAPDDPTPAPGAKKASSERSFVPSKSLPESFSAATALLEAACMPCHGHSSGTLEEAEMILARYPQVRVSDIYTAAIVADEDTGRSLCSIEQMQPFAPPPRRARVSGGHRPNCRRSA